MIETIFSVNFYRNSLDNVSKNIVDELSLELTGENFNVDDGGASSHPDNVQYYNDVRLSSLVDNIQNETKKAWEGLEFRDDLTPVITEMWLNVVYPKGEMQDQAHHSKFSLCGVYFLHAEENSGNLVLVNPLDGMTRNLPYQPKAHLNAYQITPKTGDLIIYPSYFLYHTKENKSQSNRVTLEFAVNYKLKV